MNFRKIGNVDSNFFIDYSLWNRYSIRTTYPGSAHTDASDIWLRFNDLSLYTPDQYYKMFDDLECVDYFHIPEANKLISDLMEKVNGTKLGRVIITKLPSGGRITPHIDEGAYANYYDRYHIIINNKPGSIFRCGDETITMENGDIYWFDTSKEHEVINDSNEDRLTLIVDIYGLCS